MSLWFRRHANSWRYVWKSADDVPDICRYFHFTCSQVPSIGLVLSVASLGSMKWSVWLSSEWLASCFYARQSSVIMRMLSNRWGVMIGTNSCAHRSATGINTAFPVPRSIRSKTQWPSCQWSQWNFLCMKFDSSISTRELFAAIWMGWSTHHIAQISQI